MTKDIVARLRNYVAQFGVRAPNVVQPISEAADEIERLRAALRSIAANACCDSCREAALVARAALEGEETND